MSSPKKKNDDESPEPPEPQALADRVDEDEPGLNWDEYLERRRDLEAKIRELEARWARRLRFPRWMYHPSERPRIVGTPAEKQALGAGWQVHP